MNTLVPNSQLISRAELAGRLGLSFNEKRDIYTALGYKKILRYQDFFDRYVRQDVATRIIDAPPAATWQNPPTITSTPTFDKKFAILIAQLKLFSKIERADKVAGIGRYATLLIGTRGNLSSPATSSDILYLSVFSEANAEIERFDEDTSSPRFGLPSLYRIQLTSDTSARRKVISTQTVHYSRIIHVAEGLSEDDIYGKPRLEPVFNRLDDLEKVVGGGAEMFWLGAYRGMQADIDKDMQLDPDDEAKLSEEIDEYIHGLRRYIRTRGIKMTEFDASVADPRGAFSTIMSLISGATGIPQRILTGSERGQLASEQDVRNWNTKVRERQLSYAENIILRPLIDRLISYNALPDKPYEILWPDVTALGDVERSIVAQRIGTAVKSVSEQVTPFITPQEFREHYLNLKPTPE